MLNTASYQLLVNPDGLSSCSLRAVSVVSFCSSWLFLAAWMILLYSTIDLWDFRDPFVKLQLFLPLLDICIDWMD